MIHILLFRLLTIVLLPDNNGCHLSIDTTGGYVDTTNIMIQPAQSICCGDPVPTGWITINDLWDPTKCGKPIIGNVFNVCLIERYDNKPVGYTIGVCATSPTPAGWVVDKTYWDPIKCGHPVFSDVQNMKVIRRVN